MIQPITAYRDSAGQVHETKDAALIAEIERVIGRIGNGEGLTTGIAKKLFEVRAPLIKLLQQIDAPLVDKVSAEPTGEAVPHV